MFLFEIHEELISTKKREKELKNKKHINRKYFK